MKVGLSCQWTSSPDISCLVAWAVENIQPQSLEISYEDRLGQVGVICLYSRVQSLMKNLIQQMRIRMNGSVDEDRWTQSHQRTCDIAQKQCLKYLVQRQAFLLHISCRVPIAE